MLIICMQEFRKRELPVRTIRAQTATTTPAITEAAPEAKKTLRKCVVVITGTSSGLGLATAKALSETGQCHVIMACRNFLKAGQLKQLAFQKRTTLSCILTLRLLKVSVNLWIRFVVQVCRLMCWCAMLQCTYPLPRSPLILLKDLSSVLGQTILVTSCLHGCCLMT